MAKARKLPPPPPPELYELTELSRDEIDLLRELIRITKWAGEGGDAAVALHSVMFHARDGQSPGFRILLDGRALGADSLKVTRNS